MSTGYELQHVATQEKCVSPVNWMKLTKIERKQFKPFWGQIQNGGNGGSSEEIMSKRRNLCFIDWTGRSKEAVQCEIKLILAILMQFPRKFRRIGRKLWKDSISIYFKVFLHGLFRKHVIQELYFDLDPVGSCSRYECLASVNFWTSTCNT